MAGDKGVRRSSENHCKSLLCTLNQMRKHSSGFCDIILQVGTSRFPAHKAVTAASSDYFAALWAHGFSESKQGFVELEGIEARILEELLDFIYTGELKIFEETVSALLTAANMLGLEKAKRLCEKYVWEHLKKTNCLEVLCFAEKYSCDLLMVRARNFVADYFEELSETDDFMEISKEALAYLLNTEEMRVSSEEVVFVALLRWLSAKEGREGYVSSLIQHVKLPCISTRRLQTLTKKHTTSITIQNAVQAFTRESKKETSPKAHPRTAPTFFLLGGGGGDFRSFSPLSGEWRNLPRLEGSPFRKLFGLASAGKRLYVIGGRLEGADLEEDVADVDCFNMDTHVWSKAAPLNHPRRDLSVCVLNGAIYALGGYCNFEEGNGSGYSDAVEVLYPQKKRPKWHQLPSMPSSSYGFHLTAGFDSKLYVLSCGTMNSCEKIHIFDTCHKEWSTVSISITLNAHAGIAAAGGFVLLACDNIGGHLQSDIKLQVVKQESILKRLDVTDFSVKETPVILGNVSYRKIAGCRNGVYVFDGSNVHHLDAVKCLEWETVSDMLPGEFDNCFDRFEVALANSNR